MGIRRSLFVGTPSIKKLLDKTGTVQIQVTPAFKKAPVHVLLASRPRGLGLAEPPAPLRANSISAYLQRRSRTMGYLVDLTFYAWRNRTLTEFTRAYGPAQARLMAGHRPETYTLEEYYFEGYNDVDVAALQLDEEAISIAEESATLALTRIDAARARGRFLEAAVQRLIDSDPNFPHQGTEREKLLEKRRLRRYAQTALLQEQREMGMAKLTQVELERRRQEQRDRPSQLVQSFLASARKLQQSQASTRILEEYDRDYYQQDTVDVEDEAEAQNLPQIERLVQVEDDEVNTVDDGDAAISNEMDLEYQVAVEALMSSLLEGSFSDGSGLSYPRQCPLCETDDTMSPEAKEKTWNRFPLERHMKGKVQSSYVVWRRVQVQRAEQRDDGRFTCPYCPTAEEDMESWTKYRGLYEHVRDSTAENTSSEHDELKAADGWYEDTFHLEVEIDKVVSRNATDRHRLGIKYSADLELSDPLLVPGMPGLVYGAKSRREDERSHFRGSLVSGRRPPEPRIPDQYQNELTERRLPPGHIPKTFEGVIKRGRMKDKDEE